MTKGGKKRRGPTRSESQDSLEKQINKKRKYINDSSDNLERIQNRSELVDEEEMAKASSVHFLTHEIYMDFLYTGGL